MKRRGILGHGFDRDRASIGSARVWACSVAALMLTTACGDRDGTAGGDSATGGLTGADAGAGSRGEEGGGAEGGVSAGGTRFDVQLVDLPEIETGGMRSCTVAPDGSDSTIPCDTQAPPSSFDPEVQWSWGEGLNSSSSPLVANLTDDNGDGKIDLCDVPDIVIPVYGDRSAGAPVQVFDGASGTVHFEISEPAVVGSTPAIGDIDGDGLPEIVVMTMEAYRDFDDDAVTAYEHDGTRKWKTRIGSTPGHVALADLDNDGDVEVMVGLNVLDHEGRLMWQVNPDNATSNYPTAVDLDGDGDLEVAYGRSAYHHDGTTMFVQNELVDGDLKNTPLMAVADFDGDGEPELLVGHKNGHSMLEHDGAIKFRWLVPNVPPPTGDDSSTKNRYYRPAAVHDFDGDGTAEFAVGHGLHYTVFHGDATVLWTAEVSDGSGLASGTAFDFLGDGQAEAVFGDEKNLLVFDEQGDELLNVRRVSYTAYEYPTVADVDNDESAEVVVVSNTAPLRDPMPAVQVIRDVGDRWIPARRIWNQHTYHVTNVREDATIPQFEAPHWKALNTFRTQAQVSADGTCKPPLPG